MWVKRGSTLIRYSLWFYTATRLLSCIFMCPNTYANTYDFACKVQMYDKRYEQVINTVYILMDEEHLNLCVKDTMLQTFCCLLFLRRLFRAFPLGRFLAANISKRFDHIQLYMYRFTCNCRNLPRFADIVFSPPGFAFLLTVVSEVQSIVHSIVHVCCFVDATDKQVHVAQLTLFCNGIPFC